MHNRRSKVPGIPLTSRGGQPDRPREENGHGGSQSDRVHGSQSDRNITDSMDTFRSHVSLPPILGDATNTGAALHHSVYAPDLYLTAANTMHETPSHEFGGDGSPRKLNKSSSLVNLSKLPPIDSGGRDGARKKRYPCRYKTSLSTSLPHLHYEADGDHNHTKQFEKINYTVPMHKDLAPPPAASIHTTKPIREQTFMAAKHRRQRLAPITIKNTTKHSVAYEEPSTMDSLRTEGSSEGLLWWKGNGWRQGRTRKDKKWRDRFVNAQTTDTVTNTVAEQDEPINESVKDGLEVSAT